MTRHVSTENLARFRAGDLSTGRSVRVAAHLRDCARCRETSEALAEVPTLLASVPVPRMPAHLAARIETALAAESARRTATETDRPAQPAGAGAHAGGSRRRPRRSLLGVPALRLAAAAGAAVVVVGGGVALLSHAGSSSGGSAAGGGSLGPKSAASSQHSKGMRPEALPQTGSGTTYGGLRYQRAGHASFTKLAHSRTDYQPGQLGKQVDQVLAAASAGPKFNTAGPNITPFRPPAGHSTVLNGCVSHVAAGREVLLVDVARFNHKPATIIVTARQGRAAAQVWVVGPGCSATTSDLLAHQVLKGH